MGSVIATAVVDTVVVGIYGWEKVVVREFHFIEETAGVIFAGRTALLIGNTEIIRGNYYLYVSEKSDYGEKSQCCVEFFVPVSAVNKLIFKTAAYCLRYTAKVYVAASAVASAVNKFSRKKNWRNYFHGCFGQV